MLAKISKNGTLVFCGNTRVERITEKHRPVVSGLNKRLSEEESKFVLFALITRRLIYIFQVSG
jgi:hypothetical protein